MHRSTGSRDRKSTRLNSSHANISYAVFCLKKKKKTCSPVSGCDTNKTFNLTPNFFAYTGSKAFSASTNDAVLSFFFFFFIDTAPTEIYTLSLHDALPISDCDVVGSSRNRPFRMRRRRRNGRL